MPSKKKKKGGKGDARGYAGQHQPPHQPPKPKPSAEAPKTVPDAATAIEKVPQVAVPEPSAAPAEKSLEKPAAAAADDTNSDSSPPLVESPRRRRLASRLSALSDRLLELQFSKTQVEQAVAALQHDVTLEAALDWLCLHCETQELPSLFVNDTSRIVNTSITTPEETTSLEVLPAFAAASDKVAVASPLDPSAKVREIAETPPLHKQAVEDAAAEPNKDEQKTWILERFEGDTKTVDAKESPPASAPESGAEIIQQSPEEIALRELEQELAALEADVTDEANNYMRSKQEIKELQKELRQKRQMVKGLQRKVQKQQQKEDSKSGAAAAAEDGIGEKQGEVMKDGDDDEEFCGGLFDNENAEEETTETTPQASEPSARIECRVPKGWTGAVPAKLFQETCQKQRWPKPRYTALKRPRRGYQLVASIVRSSSSSQNSDKNRPPEPTQESWQALESEFAAGSELREFLALQALYAMDPHVALDRRIPPDFAQLWRGWQYEAAQAVNLERQAQRDAKQEWLDHLLSLVKEEEATTSTTQQSSSLPSDEEAFNNHANVRDSWDDDERDPIEAPAPSTAGKRLQQSFQQRQASSSYQKMLLEVRQTLPIWSFREQVLGTVEKHPVTIVCAETGAGKTTQCPQYLLEQALLNGYGDVTNIVVTQPRRVAATSVAERVAEELCEPNNHAVGHTVGYQIRMQAKFHRTHTKLLFCTTGIILRRLQDDPTLKHVTHVMVDEVHERQQQTDVLLIALRRLLSTTRPDLKIVLMSATMDSDLFSSFFRGAPVIQVPGRTFPVASYHLEDLMDATDHVIEPGSRYALREERSDDQNQTLWITTRGGEQRRQLVNDLDMPEQEVSEDYLGYKMSTRRSMDRVKEEVINFDLVEDVLELLLCRWEENTTLLLPEQERAGFLPSGGAILVFLPGLGEIRAMTERLEGNRHLSGLLEIVPLHSTLSSKDQRRAFLPPAKHKRKIVLSTNIAETSVTIPDVICIIDSGRMREVRRNKRTSTSTLVTDWCSRASAKQRAGRAGRVQVGLCLKLFSSKTAQNVMKANSEPELRRVPLEEVCLSILASGFVAAGSSCMEFLSQAPQPPSPDSVQAAVRVLEAVGAIELVPVKDLDGIHRKQNSERLTPLGRHLAKLPVDVRLGKMLIYGALFKCLDRVLTVAAALSASQSPFSTFLNDDASVAKAKHRAFDDLDSDFLTLCNVWEAYATATETTKHSAWTAARKFCNANYLNAVALREIADARRQFLDLLGSIGFVKNHTKPVKPSFYNENGHNPDLIHAVILAGLYPNVAHLSTQISKKDHTLFHRNERLFFHPSSVNSRTRSFGQAKEHWVVFFEKFGTPHRVSVSTTCVLGPSAPMALILFGKAVQVKHVDRLVVVDDWIRLNMAAQEGVILKKYHQNLMQLLESVMMVDQDARQDQVIPEILEMLAKS